MPDDAAAPAIAVEDAAAEIIRPRGELFVTGEDHLRVMVVNALAGVVLTIAGRSWDPTRRVIVPFLRTMAPTADRTANELRIPLAAGFVLDLTVYASTGAPLSGQTYVMVHLVRGLEANAVQLATLTADYATSMQCVCWPGDPPKSSTEGEPYVRTVVGTTPAAGAEIVETVPTGARWELLTVYYTLTTGATVVGRVSILRFKTPAGDFMGNAQPVASQPAGIQYAYSWGQNMPAVTVFSQQLSQAIQHQLLLAAGAQLTTFTPNIQANDVYNDLRFTVREWLEVP